MLSRFAVSRVKFWSVWLAVATPFAFSPGFAAPKTSRKSAVLIGDPTNGKKLHAQHCAACHGKDGRGGRTGVDLTESGRLNMILDQGLFAMIGQGTGLERGDEHRFGDRLAFLDIWDTAAHVRSLHMTLRDFFPDASRYVSKVYAIDQWGLERIEEATGKRPKMTEAAVFTFFDMDGEQGNLRYVPQNPILLDELKKDRKVGYLVFLPFETGGYQGEIGISMDPEGRMIRLLAHPGVKGAPKVNRLLRRLKGLGKKGQNEPFRTSGGRSVSQIARDVFPVYMRAMETVTMYDREERERTWADE